uniref:Uncharacterized protein n=1 Tax=Salinispora arenicola (strain CNS-205) TaxID=391037 RepID=A8LYW6_SALAI
MLDLPLSSAFVIFDAQNSGCVSHGIEVMGRRWFVERATTREARLSLARANRLHAAVAHPAIVVPEQILDGPDGPVLVVPVARRQHPESSHRPRVGPCGVGPVPAASHRRGGGPASRHRQTRIRCYVDRADESLEAGHWHDDTTR